jgi:hypothetical protein
VVSWQTFLWPKNTFCHTPLNNYHERKAFYSSLCCVVAHRGGETDSQSLKGHDILSDVVPSDIVSRSFSSAQSRWSWQWRVNKRPYGRRLTHKRIQGTRGASYILFHFQLLTHTAIGDLRHSDQGIETCNAEDSSTVLIETCQVGRRENVLPSLCYLSAYRCLFLINQWKKKSVSIRVFQKCNGNSDPFWRKTSMPRVNKQGRKKERRYWWTRSWRYHAFYSNIYPFPPP